MPSLDETASDMKKDYQTYLENMRILRITPMSYDEWIRKRKRLSNA